MAIKVGFYTALKAQLAFECDINVCNLPPGEGNPLSKRAEGRRNLHDFMLAAFELVYSMYNQTRHKLYIMPP